MRRSAESAEAGLVWASRWRRSAKSFMMVRIRHLEDLAHIQVDPIDPHVHVVHFIEAPPAPAFPLPFPHADQPADVRRAQAPRILSQQSLQRRLEVSCR